MICDHKSCAVRRGGQCADSHLLSLILTVATRAKRFIRKVGKKRAGEQEGSQKLVNLDQWSICLGDPVKTAFVTTDTDGL